MIPDGRANLREIIYDLITPLGLDKYVLIMTSGRKKVKVI
jgi:hypothetical protein